MIKKIKEAVITGSIFFVSLLLSWYFTKIEVAILVGITVIFATQNLKED